MTSLTLDEIEVHDDCAPTWAPTTTGAVELLLAQYQAMRNRIEQVAGMVTGEVAGAVSYFLEAHRVDGRHGAWPAVEKLFDAKPAVAALNAAYWSKALALTDVLDAMPQKRRSEWHEQIHEHKAPDFDEATVRATLTDLLASRSKFFAERVDGIFRSLSGEHVTNSPAAFGKRMIVARVLNDFGSADHVRSGLINDLRAVIARFMGRDEPRHSSTQPVIERLRGHWGEWVSIDGGALRIRLYKKGTAHLEVHPDMAWRLNQVLSSLYPLAIPPEFRMKLTCCVREFELIRTPLPFQVVDALASMEEARRLAPENERTSFRDNGYRRVPKSREFRYGVGKDGRQVAEEVLASIGGVKQPEGWWLFDYEPGEVLGEIVCTGCVPDQRSHQFYPTPAWLAERLVEVADVDDSHTVLEPSAGMGGLADLLPAGRTVCVEISELHCKVLEAKGHRWMQGDFLKTEFRDRFDRIVMNPPFSEGRWQAHLQQTASLLEPGGRLAAILPSSARSKAADLLPDLHVKFHGQFDDAFPGVSVSVVLLTAQRKA